MNGFRQYRSYEPDSVQQPGVYYAGPGAPAADRDVLYRVPRFLSAEFLAWFQTFLADPSESPVFLREWRRHSRRAGPTGMRLGAIAIATGSALLAIPFLAVLRSTLSPLQIQAVIAVVFFLPGVAAGLLGLFLGLRSSTLAWNRATLEELALTGIGPQEIVFGHLLGGVLPFALPLVAALPGIGIVAADLLLRGMVINVATALGLVLFIVPNAAASLLCSAAIASSLSFADGDTGQSFLRPIAGWLAVSVAILAPVFGYLAITWPWTLLIGAPVLIMVKLLVAGAFIQHLAHRVVE